jgi:hypothetical protein
MRALITLLALAVPAFAQPGRTADRLPADARFLAGIRWAAATETELARQHGGRLKELFGDLPGGLATIGIEPAKVDRIWLAAGDAFPAGTLLIIEGNLNPGAIEARLNEIGRERKFIVRPSREQNRNLFEMESPVGWLPIPGLPLKLHLAAGDDAFLVASDRDTLLKALRKPAAEAGRRFEPFADLWKQPVAAVLLTPDVLAAPDAALAGVASATFELSLTDAVIARAAFKARDAAAFSGRLSAGLEQARQLFEPLATQQGLDAKLIAGIRELLKRAKVEAADDAVALTARLDAASLAQILGK